MFDLGASVRGLCGFAVWRCFLCPRTMPLCVRR